ncbi:BLUF domain-containing protein [uncultured Brevundimonas sp.]|uniref:BLUF domain-containing protein n=1 Tax=uncultured Brevundimonas sp. TaxID=213418 RepID=UPI00262B8F45|nr:BLUF domain-containing protein [uncultured Brevundimonas sp.]
MNLALERVIYISESTNPDPALISLADILATSDRNNRRDDLTGALLVNGGRFLQVLEGAHQDLNRTLDRLQRDGRHRDIQILCRNTADHRQFGQWTMVAARISPDHKTEMDQIIHLSSTAPQEAADRMLALVQQQAV